MVHAVFPEILHQILSSGLQAHRRIELTGRIEVALAHLGNNRVDIGRHVLIIENDLVLIPVAILAVAHGGIPQKSAAANLFSLRQKAFVENRTGRCHHHREPAVEIAVLRQR